MMSIISGHRRPYLSASHPNSSAPTGRIARVAIRVNAISATERWNPAAIAGSVITTMKKSNASSVQPRKLAASVCAASRRVMRLA
jgi:hypothetical protein